MGTPERWYCRLGDPIVPGRGGRQHLDHQRGNPGVGPLGKGAAIRGGNDEEIGLQQLSGPKIQIRRREHDGAEPVGLAVGLEPVVEGAHRELMAGPWARAHQQLAIDQFVEVAVVGEGQDLVAGPAAGQFGHGHTVRSAVRERQLGIPYDGVERCEGGTRIVAMRAVSTGICGGWYLPNTPKDLFVHSSKGHAEPPGKKG